MCWGCRLILESQWRHREGDNIISTFWKMHKHWLQCAHCSCNDCIHWDYIDAFRYIMVNFNICLKEYWARDDDSVTRIIDTQMWRSYFRSPEFTNMQSASNSTFGRQKQGLSKVSWLIKEAIDISTSSRFGCETMCNYINWKSNLGCFPTSTFVLRMGIYPYTPMLTHEPVCICTHV